MNANLAVAGYSGTDSGSEIPDASQPMIAEERRRRLLDLLHERGVLSAAEAMKLLRASRMTVHRDFEMLSAAGMLRKVHGGAVPVSVRPSSVETARPFTERKPVNMEAKQAIARHIVKLIAGARTLALDASSTIFPLAGMLELPQTDGGLFVMTNGVQLFEELQRKSGFRVALTGGELHPRTGSLVGPLAIKSLEGMRFDYAIVSAAGVSEDEGSAYDSTPEGAALKQAFLSRATRTILAVDKSKFGISAPYPLKALADFDMVVTEEGQRRRHRRRADAGAALVAESRE